MASLISRNKLAVALAIACTLALARAADTNDVHLTILQRMSDAREGKDKCAPAMWKDNKCTLDSWKVRPPTTGGNDAATTAPLAYCTLPRPTPTGHTAPAFSWAEAGASHQPLSITPLRPSSTLLLSHSHHAHRAAPRAAPRASPRASRARDRARVQSATHLVRL